MLGARALVIIVLSKETTPAQVGMQDTLSARLSWMNRLVSFGQL